MTEIIFEVKQDTADGGFSAHALGVVLTELKARIQAVQIKAAMSVNSELIGLYWELAEKIVAKQRDSQWGDGLLTRMSKDLQTEFPGMKGFSKRNFELMRQWYQF